MTPAIAWAVVCGLTLGIGLWALVSMMPRLSRPRLVDRVAPYVLDVSEGARELVARRPADPLPVLGFVFAPLVGALRRALGVILGGPDATGRRLRQAGSALSVEDFRGRQLVWGATGAGIGVLAAAAAGRANSLPLLAQLGIVLVFAAGGVALRDYLLQRAAKARLARMAGELPTVLEFLTLSLSAGEGILDAVRRISRISTGELSGELGRVVADVNTGLPFAESLDGVSRDLDLPPFTRFVEQVTGALDRGTPLVEVLRAQAQDSRDDAKRELLEVAGKKEVAMLIPLVFLILPITIAFAIFPGILVLRMGL
ncbi:tight adherence protein C [Conyzicola lurida]|uniref:Tight adherence protein C n=1 Tax=Conyzicola lurida TaxID=1172621 RepID=A0A841AH43_9MICO|nr:type II secretion system F family protein [Conyzicola lurida]MBB5842537.1 tight adherence protein C [Conyzicola lurida]